MLLVSSVAVVPVLASWRLLPLPPAARPCVSLHLCSLLAAVIYADTLAAADILGRREKVLQGVADTYNPKLKGKLVA